MSHYELTLLTRSEEETGSVADTVAQLGGAIKHQLAPVRRKLAYPIRRETAAVYHTYEFDLPQDQTGPLEAKLRGNSQVLRHLLIADGIRKDVETPRKLKASNLEIPESLTKGMAELAAAEQQKTPEPSSTAKPTQPDEPTPTDEVSAEGSTAKERQEKLDEKLKSILGK